MTELERQGVEVERADRSIFVQELLLSSLAESLRLSDEDDSSSNHSSMQDTAEEHRDDGSGKLKGFH